MCNTFFTSDLHFHHKNIIGYMPNREKEYGDVHTMNEKIIEQWNTQVNHNDKVYLLGDVSFGNESQVKDILGRLNGRILLVEGNHDWEEENYKYRPGFSFKNLEITFPNLKVLPRIYGVKIGKYKAYLSHMPLMQEELDHNPYGKKIVINLHGHTHCSLGVKTGSYRMDVGWDGKHALYSEQDILDTLNLEK